MRTLHGSYVSLYEPSVKLFRLQILRVNWVSNQCPDLHKHKL